MMSSSMIAVSSILSFDIYKSHINPNASDRRLVHFSHLAVVAHAILITGVLLGMNYGGANMILLGYFWPIFKCPGVIPLIFFPPLLGPAKRYFPRVHLHHSLNPTLEAQRVSIFFDLQKAQSYKEKVSEFLLMIRSNTKVVTYIKNYYLEVLASLDS